MLRLSKVVLMILIGVVACARGTGHDRVKHQQQDVDTQTAEHYPIAAAGEIYPRKAITGLQSDFQEQFEIQSEIEKLERKRKSKHAHKHKSIREKKHGRLLHKSHPGSQRAHTIQKYSQAHKKHLHESLEDEYMKYLGSNPAFQVQPSEYNLKEVQREYPAVTPERTNFSSERRENAKGSTGLSEDVAHNKNLKRNHSNKKEKHSKREKYFVLHPHHGNVTQVHQKHHYKQTHHHKHHTMSFKDHHHHKQNENKFIHSNPIKTFIKSKKNSNQNKKHYGSKHNNAEKVRIGKQEVPKMARRYSVTNGIPNIPELEGFVLEDYDDGNEIKNNIIKAERGNSDRNKQEFTHTLEIRKSSTTPPLNIEDLTVGVEKFEDFDLTVLDVPSLSNYPEFILKNNINSKGGKNGTSANTPQRGDPIEQIMEPTIIISGAGNKSDSYHKRTKNPQHHISRRVGDSSEAFPFYHRSWNTKKKHVVPLFLTRNDRHIELQGRIVKARSRREEGPSPKTVVSEGAKTADLKESPEPLELDVDTPAGLGAEVGEDFEDNVMSKEVQEGGRKVEAKVTGNVTDGSDAIVDDGAPVPNILPALSCITSAECNITNSVCINSQCDCPDVFPVYIGRAAGCFKGVSLTDPCTHDEECLRIEENFSACVNFKCDCVPGYVVKRHPNVGMNCVKESGRSPQVDPAMYGVLGGLGLMFIIICVVLRLFSKARFRETRSIFNTPNPRLMNASLFKDSKLLSPARTERRGSRASVRAPSRTASLASVNAAGTVNKSPNGSLTNKGRRGSVASTASGRVGTPGAPSARNHSPVPEASKDGDVTSPTKSTNKETSVAIEAVD